MPNRFFIILLLSVQTVFANGNTPKELSVLTSIRPIQLITNEIMKGAGSAELLISSDLSPHHFQLKPSHLKQVSRADVLIWISNDFETSLEKLQYILPKNSARLELAKLMAPENQKMKDGHIWLSIESIIKITSLIENKLSDINIKRSRTYRENAKKLIEDLKQWKLNTFSEFKTKKPSYISEHNSLSYFEKDFNFNHSNSLNNSHDHGSSIKHRAKLHKQLDEQKVSCILYTDHPVSNAVQELSNHYRIRPQPIDIMGQKVSTIIELLDNVSSTLQSCR